MPHALGPQFLWWDWTLSPGEGVQLKVRFTAERIKMNGIHNAVEGGTRATPVQPQGLW